jgi:hypothetical protein
MERSTHSRFGTLCFCGTFSPSRRETRSARSLPSFFYSLKETQVVIEKCWVECKSRRPHSTVSPIKFHRLWA